MTRRKMTFGAPWDLLGLAGLLVPFVIHLLNRSRGRVVHVGTVRFLRPAPWRRRFLFVVREKWLLLLRMLLLALLAVWMAEPRLTIFQSGFSDRHAFVSQHAWSRLNADRRGEIVRESARAGIPLKLLARGFPDVAELDSKALGSASMSAWGQLHLLAELPTHHTITVYALESGAERGFERPAMVDRVDWRWIRDFQTDNAAAMKLAIVASTDREEDRRYVAAAIEALSEERALSFPLTFGDPMDADVIFQLGGAESVVPPGCLLIRDQPVVGDAAAEFEFHGERYSVRLTPTPPGPGRALLTTTGGQTLARLDAGGVQWMSRFHPDACGIVASDQFPFLLKEWFVDLAVINPRALRSESRPKRADALSVGLAVFIALLWLLERWSSERRRRHA